MVSRPQSLTDTVSPVISESANTIEALGRRSENPVLDFAVLAAQYRRALVQALPTYTPVDQHLYKASLDATRVVNNACLATEG
jgi:hypothetical protein